MRKHKSVLLGETIEALNLKEGMTVVDATLGAGGHSREILKKIGESGKLIVIDQDQEAIDDFKKSVAGDLRVSLVKDNFSNLDGILRGLDIFSVDAILADLGFSSDQLEDEKRGLSFQKDSPLDMRLDQANELTAEKIVNEYDLEKIEKILKEYGEEQFARNIAKKICEAREIKRIQSTFDLVGIINKAIPEKFKHGKIHCATKTFQALRIAINQELEVLEKFVPVAIEKLKSGGRLAIISFHSLEDRIVKNIFRENARGCICPPDFPQCVCGRKAKIKIITRKPVESSDLEVAENSRSRSAKLRVLEKNKDK